MKMLIEGFLRVFLTILIIWSAFHVGDWLIADTVDALFGSQLKLPQREDVQ